MIVCSFASTSAAVHDRRMAFCDISSPEVATPPALDALPGANRTPAWINASTAPKVDGIFAPSATHSTPLAIRVCASCSSNSFCVAHGKAISTAWCHGRLPASNVKPCACAKSAKRPRCTFLNVISSANNSGVMPCATNSVPPESDSVSTFAPNCMAFSQAYCATLPEPETATVLPTRLSPRCSSISWVKYTVP